MTSTPRCRAAALRRRDGRQRLWERRCCASAQGLHSDRGELRVDAERSQISFLALSRSSQLTALGNLELCIGALPGARRRSGGMLLDASACGTRVIGYVVLARMTATSLSRAPARPASSCSTEATRARAQTPCCSTLSSPSFEVHLRCVDSRAGARLNRSRRRASRSASYFADVRAHARDLLLDCVRATLPAMLLFCVVAVFVVFASRCRRVRLIWRQAGCGGDHLHHALRARPCVRAGRGSIISMRSFCTDATAARSGLRRRSPRSPRARRARRGTVFALFFHGLRRRDNRASLSPTSASARSEPSSAPWRSQLGHGTAPAASVPPSQSS